MKIDFSTIEKMFQTNAEWVDRAIAGVPPEAWLARPGNGSNHLTWILGHMITARANVPRILGKDWSAPRKELFTRGSKLAAPEEYPESAAMKQAWQEVSQLLDASLATVSESTLTQPAPENSPSLDGTIGGYIAFFSLHESYHIGQLGYLKKRLGFGQTVG
jgi:uncharacterized damage-inducible protein DinB